jgi:hypothetical protein
MYKCLTALCLLIQTILSAQHAGQQVWDDENGLTGHTFTHFFQDSKGRMWAGTYDDGARCFDGKKWTAFQQHSNNGLCHKTVNQIMEDEKGAIWFRHNDKGISRLYKGKWKHWNNENTNAKKLYLLLKEHTKEIYAYCFDKKNCNQAIEVYKFNLENEEFEIAFRIDIKQYSHIQNLNFNVSTFTNELLLLLLTNKDNQVSYYYQYKNGKGEQIFKKLSNNHNTIFHHSINKDTI